MHSLGPKDTSALGKYQSIIEENKADMGALAFLDLLTEKGCYTQEEADTVAFSAVADMFLKAKPSMSQAHRVRTVMQNKFFMDRAFGNSIRTTKFTSILKKFSLLQKKCLHRLYEFK